MRGTPQLAAQPTFKLAIWQSGNLAVPEDCGKRAVSGIHVVWVLHVCLPGKNKHALSGQCQPADGVGRGPTWQSGVQAGNLAIWQSGQVKQNARRHAAPSSFHPQHARRGGWPIAREDPVSHVFPRLPGASPPLSAPSPRPMATLPPRSLATKRHAGVRTLASYTEQTGRTERKAGNSERKLPHCSD